MLILFCQEKTWYLGTPDLDRARGKGGAMTARRDRRQAKPKERRSQPHIFFAKGGGNATSNLS